MNGLQELQSTLTAVSVSIAGPHSDHGLLRLRELVDLFSQIAPVFHAMQLLDVSSPSPVEHALLVFYNQEVAQQAVELFDGYPLDTGTSLEVHLAAKQPLQRLAQVLVKCMQAASFSSPEYRPGLTSTASPNSRQHAAPTASPYPSPLGIQRSWHQHAQQALGPAAHAGPAPPFPPPHFPASSAPAVPNHSDLAAAAAAAWGAHYASPAGPFQPPGFPPSPHHHLRQQEQPLAAAPAPAGAWGIPDTHHRHLQQHQQQQHQLCQPGEQVGGFHHHSGPGPNGGLAHLPPPPSTDIWGQQQQQQQQQHEGFVEAFASSAQHAQHTHTAGQHSAINGADAEGPPEWDDAVAADIASAGEAEESDAEMMRLHLGALALRRQQDEFLAQHRAQQADPPEAEPAQQQPHQAKWVAVAASGQRPQEGELPRVLTVPRPQLSLQRHQLPAASGRRGDAGGAGGEEEEGWEEVGAGKSSSRRSGIGGGAGGTQAADQGGSGGPPEGLTSRLYVRNIQQKIKADQIRAVFGKYGALHEVVKFPEVGYAFITYTTVAAAAAAFARLHEEVIPSLCEGSIPLWIEFRDTAGSSGSGTPTKAAASGVGKGKAAHTTYEGSISRDPSKNPLPTKRHEGDADKPTTKLWVGGISGDATEEMLKRVFGKYGPVFGIELRPAPELGRRDQWAFVNFRKESDCARARDDLVDRVIPELTGSMRLKLRYKEPHGKEAQLAAVTKKGR